MSAGLLALLAPSLAFGQSTVGVVFRGNVPAVEKQVEQALLDSFLVAPSGTNEQLSRNWERPAVAKLSNRNVGGLKLVVEIGDASGVDVIIAAEVERKGRGRSAKPSRLHLAAIRVADGSLLLKDRIAIRARGRGKRRKMVADTRGLTRYLKRVASAMAKAPPAAPSEPAAPDPFSALDTGATLGGERKPEAAASAPTAVREEVPRIDRAEWTRAGRTLDVATYGLVRGRSFRYFDTLTRNLREFDSGISYGVGAQAEVYPLIFERESGTTRRVGLVGGYAQDFGIQPSVADAPGVVLDHAWSEWFAGASVAWDFRDVLLAARATYGEYAARFDAPEDFAAARELPSVRYQNLALAVSGRYEMESLALLFGAQYAFIRRAGEVGDELFPNSAAGGIRIRAGVSTHLFSGVEAFAAGVYDHFFYDMRSQRGDEFLAGGALDLHLTGELGVSYAY